MQISKPKNIDTSDYFAGYVNLAKGACLLDGLEEVCEEALLLFQSISEEQSNSSYQEGKWSIKQLVQHLIDTERVFCYRALSFARGDQRNLPGFEEDSFAANDCSEERPWETIIQEYIVVREASLALFASFNAEVLDNQGLANDVKFTPRILGWVLVGHDAHHLSVLKERYLSNG